MNSFLSRRTLLKLFTVTGILGILGYSRVVKPQPTIHQWDTLTLPRKLNKPKKVRCYWWRIGWFSFCL